MKRIGIVGENPDNDSKPIKIVLEKECKNKKVHFFILLKKLRGSKLDGPNGKPSAKAIRTLQKEFKDYNLDFVIYIRDLDASPSDKKLIQLKQDWFKLLDSEAANGKGVFLLNIYELEALILADIEAFNQLYQVNIAFKGNPMFQAEPKEWLKGKTEKSLKRQYLEAHALEIFEELNPEKLKNHPQYHQFVQQLTEQL